VTNKSRQSILFIIFISYLNLYRFPYFRHQKDDFQNNFKKFYRQSALHPILSPPELKLYCIEERTHKKW